MNPATGADLEARSLRTLTPQEMAVGTQLLDDAWAIITSARPWVADVVDDPTPAGVRLRSLVVQIACAMVLRVINNPDGKLQEQIDDYSWRRDAAVSTGSLYLSDAESALIGPGNSGSDGAFTIRPAGLQYGAGYWASTDAWVPLP